MAVQSFSSRQIEMEKGRGRIRSRVDGVEGVSSEESVVMVFLVGIRFNIEHQHGDHHLSFSISSQALQETTLSITFQTLSEPEF